jgi:hypothetical protein
MTECSWLVRILEGNGSVLFQRYNPTFAWMNRISSQARVSNRAYPKHKYRALPLHKLLGFCTRQRSIGHLIRAITGGTKVILGPCVCRTSYDCDSNYPEMIVHGQLINYMEQSSSWEANSHSHSKEIPRLLWNPKVHDHVLKSPQLVPILRQMHPVLTFSSCFPTIHSNIILVYSRFVKNRLNIFTGLEQHCVHLRA